VPTGPVPGAGRSCRRPRRDPSAKRSVTREPSSGAAQAVCSVKTSWAMAKRVVRLVTASGHPRVKIAHDPLPSRERIMPRTVAQVVSWVLALSVIPGSCRSAGGVSQIDTVPIRLGLTPGRSHFIHLLPKIGRPLWTNHTDRPEVVLHCT
jgi:hypothetical protein